MAPSPATVTLNVRTPSPVVAFSAPTLTVLIVPSGHVTPVGHRRSDLNLPPR